MVHPICLLLFIFCIAAINHSECLVVLIPFLNDHQITSVTMKCHILIALSTVYPQVGKYVFLNHFVTFLSVYCFSITSLQLCCSISDGFYLFFSLRRTCHPGGRDILMMHCLSFSEERLLLITIFLESEKISLIHLYLFLLFLLVRYAFLLWFCF